MEGTITFFWPWANKRWGFFRPDGERRELYFSEYQTRYLTKLDPVNGEPYGYACFSGVKPVVISRPGVKPAVLAKPYKEPGPGDRIVAIMGPCGEVAKWYFVDNLKELQALPFLGPELAKNKEKREKWMEILSAAQVAAGVRPFDIHEAFLSSQTVSHLTSSSTARVVIPHLNGNGDSYPTLFTGTLSFCKGHIQPRVPWLAVVDPLASPRPTAALFSAISPAS